VERLKELEKKRHEFLDNRTKKTDRERRSRSRSYEHRRNERRKEKEEHQKKEISNKDESLKNGEARDPREIMGELEIQMIKGKYLGTIKDKKKQLIKPSDKFKQVFLFDWDESEDTSKDINPLYQNRADPKFLFGKGHLGGLDPEEMKFPVNPHHKSEAFRKEQVEQMMVKRREEMTERDWRILRENYDIITKGGRIPQPIRNWDEIEGLDASVRDNIAICGY